MSRLVICVLQVLLPDERSVMAEGSSPVLAIMAAQCLRQGTIDPARGLPATALGRIIVKQHGQSDTLESLLCGARNDSSKCAFK